MKLSVVSSLAIAAAVAIVGMTPAAAGNSKRERVFVPPANSVDTVGSIVYDSRGYAYNRFSGERYYHCVIDEGYGRVTPCDSGTRR